MDYKKKYKEEVVRATQLWECGDITRENLEYIFPELKESEDEKMRKAIHIYLDWLDGRKDYAPKGEYTIKDMIAWLDEQGEQKGTNGNEKEIPNEQKPTEEYHGEDYGIDGLWHAQRILEKTLGKVNGYQTDDGILSHECAITAVKKLYEQKPAEWSEEDISKVQRICKYLNEAKKYYADITEVRECMNWLKSLKDRVQPKQEWSEEDIRNIENIDSILFYDKDLSEDTCVRLRNWLESLKPQNHWKPTEEQMEAIRIAAEVGTANDSWAMDILKKLYNQLKLELKGVHNNEKEKI